MAGGVSLTSIDFFTRSESKIIGVDRITDDKLTVLFDDYIRLPNDGAVTIRDFSALMPNRDQYNVHYTNKSMNFEGFDDYVYYWGQSHVREMPYFYQAYSFYEADPVLQQYKFYSFVNMTNAEGVAIYPQSMYESILKVAMNDTQFEYKVRNTPYPSTHVVKERKRVGNTIAVIFMSAVAFSMLVTSIVGHIVEERVVGFKHMQLITGLNLAAYWAANFFIDLLKLELVVGVAIISFQIAKLKFYTAWIVFLLYPIAVIPFTYVTSFLFGSLSAAQTGTMFMNFGMIVFGTTLIHYMRWMVEWEAVGDPLHFMLRFLPQYTIGASIYFDAMQADLVEFREVTRGNGPDLSLDPWTKENVLGDAVSLLGHFFLWFFILIIIELGFLKTIKGCFDVCVKSNINVEFAEYEEDADVEEEVKRIERKDDEEFQICVRNFSKVYMTGSGPCSPGNQLNAVENLSFGLEKGECMCLLGVNGAGKTSIFKSLTANEEPTTGSITIEGMDIYREFTKARKLLGYCPQFNPIFDSLTVDQNMEFYATIKGI